MEKNIKLLIVHDHDGEILRAVKISTKFKGTVGFKSSVGGTTIAASLPKLTSSDLFEQLQEIKKKYKIRLSEATLISKND